MRPGVALRPGTPIEQVYPLVSLNITSLVILLLFFLLATSSMKKPTKESLFTVQLVEQNKQVHHVLQHEIYVALGPFVKSSA
jgi:hypothetical protein